MSPAGLNRVAELTTFSYPSDDSSGGAQPSGSVVYRNLTVRIKSEEPVMALIQQGVQTETIYSAYVFAGNIDIHHNDQIRITAPANDWFYNKIFRVIGIQRSSNNLQDRNFVRVTLRRFEESHSNALQ